MNNIVQCMALDEQDIGKLQYLFKEALHSFSYQVKILLATGVLGTVSYTHLDVYKRQISMVFITYTIC